MSIPWNEYPRPQLRRDSCLILNGQWEFALLAEGEAAPEQFPDRIIVPFCPESVLSGVHMPILPRQVMVYRRIFSVPKGFLSEKTLLHFGAVDQQCTVSLNGMPVGSHIGGYLPFSFDVTEAVREGENEITVTATDPLDHDLPWGKQKYQRGGMWYTPVSGIWQTVWMESLSLDAVNGLTVDAGTDAVTISVDTDASEYHLSVPQIGYEADLTEKTVTLSIPSPRRWTPDNPYLYEFTLRTKNDRVTSYFALRTVEIGTDGAGYPCVLLNGKPIFLHGVLDQGYFADGIYTPASSDGYKSDILRMKEMGFNLLRKHIKVEPSVFYYLCDRLGMLVLQDFVNTGEYSFLRDTALPTVGIKRMPELLRHRSTHAKAFFLQNAVGTQDLLHHFPCVIGYTVFNEGWGQFSADAVYDFFKRRDPSRIYDATSGWFHGKRSDFDSRHIYFRKLRMKAGKRPLFLSEFGGYAYRDPLHAFSNRVYGYRNLKTREEFENAVMDLYENQVLPLRKKGLGGAVYTQLSDVEDETNGLVTYDRQVVKISAERMKRLSEKLLRDVDRDL